MDPGRAGAFFLGDSGSYDVPIFILLRLWKPELPCGGGIRGNMIDLYFNTVAECYEFGRRSCTVYILD